MMNPSPTEIAERFPFVKVTLIQYATVAGHLPGVTASSVKTKPKKANKAEVTVEELSKEETQANATTPKAKVKEQGQGRGTPQKVESKPPETKKGKDGVKGKRGKSESKSEKRKQQCIPFFRCSCQKGDHCKYERQVDSDGRPIPVGPEILQKYDEAVKRFNENRAQAKAKAAPSTTSMIITYYRRGAQETQEGKWNRQVLPGEYQKGKKAKEGDWRDGIQEGRRK